MLIKNTLYYISNSLKLSQKNIFKCVKYLNSQMLNQQSQKFNELNYENLLHLSYLQDKDFQKSSCYFKYNNISS